MIEDGTCPDISQSPAIEVAACWLEAARLAAIADPWTVGIVFGCALATVLVSRSVTIGLAVLLCSFLLVAPLAGEPDAFQQRLRLGGAVLALALLWIGCARLRRTAVRQRLFIADLSAEKEDIQARLDREITWRRAAEPADNGDKIQQ